MRPSLLPHLVNGPFEDPALFIRFLFENRAIMFDLGDIHALSTRDILYSPDNLDKIVAFANGSDQFYVEAAFLEADAHIAAQKYHLTAKQAGEIAGLAGAKKIIPFHFSPRYSDEAQRLETEALTAFNEIRNEI